MAIKIGVKKRKTAAREFTDRIKPQQAFWNRYNKVRNEGSTIITYYGAGGVGKSSLLKKLMEEVQTQKSNQTLRENVAAVYYDFENDFDTRTILQNLKLQLMAEGCEFPLFETGDFYYSLKTGNADEKNPPKIRSMMEKNFWLSKLKKHWEPIIATLDTLMPGIKTITTAMTVAGNLLVDYWRSKQMLDEEHEEINARLNEAKISDNPNDIYKILPELFARDVTDWLNDGETNKILVVFLDTYEKLVNETVVSPMQRSRDLWLRSDEGDPTGIIFIIPRTLWVISGRNKIRWSGELSEEMDQHLISALSEDDSDYFLKKSGVENPSLRKNIIALTQGLPIFLDLCVTFYEKYKQHKGTEPAISEFGVKHQEVVDRLIKYMDAPTQDMIKFLCALNQWTDEIAFEIGSRALPNFSMAIYNQAKNFSFIQLEDVQIDEFHSEIYTFDKTVQGIIFPTCDKPVLQKIGDVADEYFAEKIQDSQDDDEYIFYVLFWAKLIARVADDSKSLSDRYADGIASQVNNLVDFAKFDIAEDIVNTFLEKAGSPDNSNKVDYAYFHVVLANIKHAQRLYEDALKLNQYFYDTCLEVFGEKDIHTLTAMNNLANVLRDLEKYEEALKLQKKVLATAQEMFGDKDSFTLTAMGNLTVTLANLRIYDKAEELERKVLALTGEMYGEEHPDTILAMSNLASTLSHAEKYEEALKLQEQALNLRQKIFGDTHPETLSAMGNLALTLAGMGRNEEGLEMQAEVLNLSRQILGEKHPDTLTAMGNLASALLATGRNEEALNLQEQVVTMYKEIFGEKHPDTLTAMGHLALVFSELNRDEEALILQKQIFSTYKEMFGYEHLNTVVAMGDLAFTLEKLDRDEELAEKTFALNEKLSE